MVKWGERIITYARLFSTSLLSIGNFSVLTVYSTILNSGTQIKSLTMKYLQGFLSLLMHAAEMTTAGGLLSSDAGEVFIDLGCNNSSVMQVLIWPGWQRHRSPRQDNAKFNMQSIASYEILGCSGSSFTLGSIQESVCLTLLKQMEAACRAALSILVYLLGITKSWVYFETCFFCTTSKTCFPHL